MYVNSKDRADAFKKDLRELLIKHGAEIELEDVGRDYHISYTIECYMSQVWEDNEVIKESATIDLGRSINDYTI